jgi:hypothetical protein
MFGKCLPWELTPCHGSNQTPNFWNIFTMRANPIPWQELNSKLQFGGDRHWLYRYVDTNPTTIWMWTRQGLLHKLRKILLYVLNNNNLNNTYAIKISIVLSVSLVFLWFLPRTICSIFKHWNRNLKMEISENAFSVQFVAVIYNRRH